jgi:eukaryotic-like serine/threonine-protein kinase
MSHDSEHLSDRFLNDGSSSNSALLDPDGLDDLLTECLERLMARGSLAEISDLRSFLPTADDFSKQFILFELIKIDMAITAEAGRMRRIQDYSDALPDLLPLDSVPLDLVMEEIQLRKEQGENPTSEEYQCLFPRFDGMFEHLHHPTEATTACRKLKPPPEYTTGTQVDDFLIIQQLGKGAFATVYLAHQISMQRLVALKISRGSGDESQSLAQFDHANIVRVFDQRNLADEQIHLLYMQFHPGGTLADVVKRVRQCDGVPSGAMLLDSVDQSLLNTSQIAPEGSNHRTWIASAGWPAIVAWIGTQLAYALDEAHHQRVLHRDVKPANVLLSAEGVPKLADFNVSFAGCAGRAGAAASFGGSIGYMAPEHLRAIHPHSLAATEKVEEAADLYSLAVLLWELWQGHRPFVNAGQNASWSDAVAQQLHVREIALVEPRRLGGAAERILENVLRTTLSYSPDERPKSGAELAGKLRLVLLPEVATFFDIIGSTIRLRLLRLSPWFLATLLILLPNIAGGALNYAYNHYQVVSPEMREGHKLVSWYVNLVFFPLGALIIIYFALSLIRAVQMAQRGDRVIDQDIDATLSLGHRSAMISGPLWLLGGIVFVVAFYFMFPQFTMHQAIHLIVSSLVCGGIAMVYPFFGMAIVASWIYYPFYVGESIQDDRFDIRKSQMVFQSEIYLLVAALIPLVGAILMISNQTSSRMFTLTAIGAGVAGLLASTFAHRQVVKAWTRMSEVLSTEKSSLPNRQ